MKTIYTNIIGREEEINALNDAYNSNESEFVAVYGRRRIGKTFLVKQVFEEEICFEYTGIQNVDKQTQINNFCKCIQKQLPHIEDRDAPTSWLAAFHLLISTVKKVKVKRKEKKIIFIDEVPWMANQKSDFITGLDVFWNSYANWSKDIVLIICGSAASWIIEKIMNNRGGLHNRITKRIRLLPFNLYETKLFLQRKQINYTNYQLLQLYMVFGGVPHYLKEIKKSKSVAQNINDICFKQNGLLYNEFNNLYDSLFKNANNHIAVIRALAKKQKGLTRNEIVATSKITSGGTITTVLNELIESGFIDAYYALNKKTKDTLYRLTDEYSLFYLKYIENTNIKANTWLDMMANNGYKVWCGFAFENICLKHIDQIEKGLQIFGVPSYHSSWVHKSQSNGSAQIDLLIIRSDGVVHVCEMKFSNSIFTITKSYDKQLQNKIAVFENVANPKKQVILTFITTYGLVQNMYSISNVGAAITMNVLFYL